MSCVAWWTECQGDKGCGHISYSRGELSKCEKCGCSDVISIREWDEEGDHDPLVTHTFGIKHGEEDYE